MSLFLVAQELLFGGAGTSFRWRRSSSCVAQVFLFRGAGPFLYRGLAPQNRFLCNVVAQVKALFLDLHQGEG